MAIYGYTAEDSVGVDQAAAHEANRTPQTRAAQVYLKTIQYGNVQPYFPDWTAVAEPPLPTDWMFSVVLDYGDHASVPPTPQADQPWPLRPDPFSSYRACFEVRTYRRVQRLLFFNDFPNEPTAGPDYLTRSVDLVYSDQQAPPDPIAQAIPSSVSVTQTGYRQGDQGLVTRSMPSLDFSYSQPEIRAGVSSLLTPTASATCLRGWTAVGSDGSTWTAKVSPASSATPVPPGTTSGTSAPTTWHPPRRDADGEGKLRAAGDSCRSAVVLDSVPLPGCSTCLAAAVWTLSNRGPDVGFFERTEDGTFEPCNASPAAPPQFLIRTSHSLTSPATGWPTS